MVDLALIKRNVARMAAQGAPEEDIDGYISAEGATIDQVRDFQPGGTNLVSDYITNPLLKTGKSIVAGVGGGAIDLARLATDPVLGLFGVQTDPLSTTERVRQGFDQLTGGRTAPQGQLDEISQKATEYAASAFAPAGLANKAAGPLANVFKVGARELPAIFGGSIGAATAENLVPDSPLASIAGGLAGGLTASQLDNMLATGGRGIQPITGEVLPMTRGQKTQDPRLQSLENKARAGVIDEKAREMINKRDADQQSALRAALGDAAGHGGIGGDDNLQNAGRILQQEYKTSKAGVSKAYDDANIIKNVFVKKEPLVNGFVPQVKNILYKSGFDAQSLSPKSQKIIGEVTDGPLSKQKLTAVNLEKMEFWRRRLSNAIEENKDALGKLSPEGNALSQIQRGYDSFMAKLPAEALKSGDEQAIRTINNARALRRRQGILFERDKAVEQIVKNDNLTNEELANIVLSGQSRAEKINSSSGRVVRAMKRAAGERGEELADNLRKGTIARMMERAQVTRQVQGQDVNVISPNKMLTEIDNLLKNKTFVREVFKDNEREIMVKLRNDLQKIASEQEFTRNYSNTAYALVDFLRRLPFGLSAVSGAIKIAAEPLGARGARRDLQESLYDFSNDLPGILEQLRGGPMYYGITPAQGVQNVDDIIDEEDEE